MEWFERLNDAMAWIEAHLTEEMDYQRLGEIACCSSFHFQRMFTYLAGIPLSEYVRRRRMSLAAVDLQSGQERVADVAAKYGYQSPTAFNRAFQSVHGVSPSAVRGGGVAVKSYPPLTFHLTLTGGEELQYRIEDKGFFQIVGVSAPLHQNIEQNFQIVPSMWQKAVEDGTLERLAGLMETPGVLGLSVCGDGEAWRYFIAVASSRPAEGLEAYTVPAATWAIFPGSGTNQSVQELERRIVTEWLPSSGYEYADAPDIEVYLNPDPQNAKYEVWIPVRKA